MTRSHNRQELLQRLKDSKVLSADELDKFVAAAPDSDGPALAHSLVANGLLTAYQLDAISRGTVADLRIGNYDVLDRLGAGGMGTVFKARHRRMKRIVALKVLSRQLGQDESFVQRFQREVETIARLSHPHVVMAYDANEDMVGHFLVMEYVNGPDLASLVQKQGPFDVKTAVSCILQAALGLEYAHSQGIIHRDVKPANLLRDLSGVVKVTDLGLARLNNAGSTDAPGGGLTRTGGVLGTADYMPPEQAVDSASIDHRVDVYSLGCSLHYLLVGQPPYLGDTLMATLLKHRDSPIASLSQSRPDVPAALDALYQRMLAKQPAARPQTMSEVVRELTAIQTSLDTPAAAKQESAQQQERSSSLGGGLATLIRQPAVATFSPPGVSAPMATDQTIDLRPPATQPDGQTAILLVEPSRAQAGIIRRYLQTLGLEQVVTVSSGQEALQAVTDGPPAAILSALHLKDMTGIELARQVYNQSPPAHAGGSQNRVGFVLISSESESEEAGQLSRTGQAVMLRKPFTLGELAQALSLASPRFLTLKVPEGAEQSPSMVKAPTDKPAPPASTPGRDRTKVRVLLADDSAPARLHLRTVLSALGFMQFVEVTDGAGAIAAVARDPFDLIVTDYNMPLLDGHGLVSYLKQNPATAAVPIIMVTTETDPAKLERVRQQGVTICEKSFAPEVVRKILDQLL